MKTKRIIVITLVLILGLSLAVPSAYAGRRHRHHLEGFLLGLGAAAIGSAIIHHHAAHRYQPAPVYHAPPPRGHWEVQKVWVPEQRQEVWNPGHYDHHGNWVEGHYISVVTEPGHWEQRKVWIGYR